MGDHDVARAIILGAPAMDDSMVGTWIAYKFDEDGGTWWAGQVKRVSMDSSTTTSSSSAGSAAAGSAAVGGVSAGEGVLTQKELDSLKVVQLRGELTRLGLETAGVKRVLIERLLEAQASGRALAIQPKKKRAAPKKASATRDINTVPRQAGWAWIEFSDGEENWFHLRASHFGDELKDQERRGAWRRALPTDQGMGKQWSEPGGAEASSGAGAGAGSATGGGSSEDAAVEEVEAAELGPDDERVKPGAETVSSESEVDEGSDVSDGDDDDWKP